MVTNNPTREALLLAVLAAPADDSPRLILADWLEEHGEAGRAAFIRAQCELALNRRHTGECLGPSSCATCRQYHALRRLERELWQGGAWRGLGAELPGECRWDLLIPFDSPSEPPSVLVRRGFVAEVSCPLAVWLAHGPDVVRRHPVEVVKIVDPANWLPQRDEPDSLLARARREAFPCGACGGKGRYATGGGADAGAPSVPPTGLWCECPACGGRGWEVGVTTPTG